MSAAQPVTTVPFEESIYASSGRLRTALRTAGLAVNVGEPHETPRGDRLHPGEADEATVYDWREQRHQFEVMNPYRTAGAVYMGIRASIQKSKSEGAA